MITKNDIGCMVEPCKGFITYGHDVKQMIGWEDDTDLPILINRHGVKHNCFPEDYFVVNIQFDQVPEEYRSKSYPNNKRSPKPKTERKEREVKEPTVNERRVSNKDLMFAILNKDK